MNDEIEVKLCIKCDENPAVHGQLCWHCHNHRDDPKRNKKEVDPWRKFTLNPKLACCYDA